MLINNAIPLLSLVSRSAIGGIDHKHALTSVRSGIVATPRELRSTYLATQIEIEVEPSMWIAADEVVERVKTPIFVITAFNPFSRKVSESENRQRMEELETALREANYTYLPAIGFSPDGSWSEPSFAVSGMGRRQAKRIGRTFEQHAIFEISADELIVLGCDGSWEERRPLFDSTSHRTGSESTDTLPDSIHRSLGLTLESNYLRAAYLGWVHEPGLGAPCKTCGIDLELFGCEARGRDGSMNRLLAFVCPSCRGLLWPFQVDEGTRICAKRRREFLLAAEDAERIGANEEYYAYVVELEGEVSEREPGSSPELPWVYVGQSSNPPEVRFAQHRDGYKASRWVKRFGSHLRPDLCGDQPQHRSGHSSKTYESWLAASLRAKGYPVKGGH